MSEEEGKKGLKEGLFCSVQPTSIQQNQMSVKSVKFNYIRSDSEPEQMERFTVCTERSQTKMSNNFSLFHF